MKRQGGNCMKSMSSKSQKQVKSPKKTSAAKKRPVAKTPAPRWKVVGDKVLFKPGRYTLADMEAALEALEETCDSVQGCS